MSGKTISKLIFTVLLAVTLSSCLATKKYEKPDIETENLYPFENVKLDSTTLADMPWQQVFEDRQLQDLIEEALANNLDLQGAIQQIRVAEANFYQGKLGLLPSLNANGSVSYSEQSDNSVNFGEDLGDISIPASEQYSVSLQSSWELDVWGKLSSTKRATFAALMQTEASRRAVQTRLIADVANAYYQLMALDRQLQITRETVKNRKNDVETVKSLKDGAILTGASVQQSIANRYAAEVIIPQLNQQITEQENALSILLGRTQNEVQRGSIDQQQPIDSLATGMPAQLLRNRPDIIAAEYAFRSAFEQTNNARAYFYPAFRLTAEGGFQSLETKNLFEPGSVFYNLVAGLTQPIFNKGVNRARLKSSKAQQEQALLQLRGSILNAGREVSNAMNQYKNADLRLEFRQKQLDALEKAVEFSRELLQYGEANYTDVLTAQQNLLSAQLSNVSDKLQQLTAGVSLYRALGGGWDKSENKELMESDPAEVQENEPADNPVIAHRGAWKSENLPQNSIASLKQAIELQAAGSEFDVLMTSDDSLVVTHGPDYQGMPVEKTSYRELAATNLRNSENLPTLREYISAGMKGDTTTRLICEIKPSGVSTERGERIAEKVIGLVSELNARAMVTYISFDYDILKKIVAINPEARTQYLAGDKAPKQLKADGISGADYNFSKFKAHPEWIESAKENDITLNAWTVNKAEDMNWLLDRGFDYITTDEPELLFQQLKDQVRN